MTDAACPCCGQSVRVNSADEGTQSYVGTEYQRGVEEGAKRERERIVAWLRSCAKKHANDRGWVGSWLEDSADAIESREHLRAGEKPDH